MKQLFLIINHYLSAKITGMRNSTLKLLVLLASLATIAIAPALADAMPEYSSRSGQSCKTCHLKPMGGELSETGLEYAASGYMWPPEGGYRVISPIRKFVRLIIGYLHILAAFLWFGTILYVHMLLKPAYAEKGLPRGEVMLGIASMGVVGITGVLLTISRVKSISVLFSSPWGIVLSLKVLIYLVMIASAILVVAFIGPRLRKQINAPRMPENGILDPLTLASFDGKSGRQALIAYDGNVYDVTELKLWKGGQHMKHSAGNDLTAFIPKAPHGDEKLEGLKKVGIFDSSMKPGKTMPQRVFYFVAYMNLALVFIAIFILAVWRWGI